MAKKKKDKFLTGGSVRKYVQNPGSVLQQDFINWNKANYAGQSMAIPQIMKLLGPMFGDMVSGLGGGSGKDDWKDFDIDPSGGVSYETRIMGGRPNSKQVEAEGGELVRDASLDQTIELKGPSHKQGGIDINADENTQIFSDKVKHPDTKEKMSLREKKRVKTEKRFEDLFNTDPRNKSIETALNRTKARNEMQRQEDLSYMDFLKESQSEKFALGGTLGEPCGGPGQPPCPEDFFEAFNKRGLDPRYMNPYPFDPYTGKYGPESYKSNLRSDEEMSKFDNLFYSGLKAKEVLPFVDLYTEKHNTNNFLIGGGETIKHQERLGMTGEALDDKFGKDTLAALKADVYDASGVDLDPLKELENRMNKGYKEERDFQRPEFDVGAALRGEGNTLEGNTIGEESNREGTFMSRLFEKMGQSNVTGGDLAGIMGNAINTINPLLSSLRASAQDSPHENFFQDVGKEGLDHLENSRQMIRGLLEQGKQDIVRNSQSSKRYNNQSSRSINTARANNLGIDSKINEAFNKLTNATMSQLLGLEGQIAGQKDKIAEITAKGAESVDTKDRMSKAASLSAVAQGWSDLGYGMAHMGKTANQMKERGNIGKLLDGMFPNQKMNYSNMEMTYVQTEALVETKFGDLPQDKKQKIHELFELKEKVIFWNDGTREFKDKNGKVLTLKQVEKMADDNAAKKN